MSQPSPDVKKPSFKPTVAVDLDGVLASYDGWKGIDHIGDPIPGAQDFLAGLRERYRVVIHTTRCAAVNCRDGVTAYELEQKVHTWLERHGFEVDGVYAGMGKPLAAAYIDDRAVSCRPQQDARGERFAYAEALTYTMYLVDDITWGDEQEKDGNPKAWQCDHGRTRYDGARQLSVCLDCGELMPLAKTEK